MRGAGAPTPARVGDLLPDLHSCWPRCCTDSTAGRPSVFPAGAVVRVGAWPGVAQDARRYGRPRVSARHVQSGHPPRHRRVDEFAAACDATTKQQAGLAWRASKVAATDLPPFDSDRQTATAESCGDMPRSLGTQDLHAPRADGAAWLLSTAGKASGAGTGVDCQQRRAYVNWYELRQTSSCRSGRYKRRGLSRWLYPPGGLRNCHARRSRSTCSGHCCAVWALH